MKRYGHDTPAIDRFLYHTAYDCNGCLLWTGGKNKAKSGGVWYGVFYPKNEGENNQSPERAHRWIMKYTLGEGFDESLMVLHKCDVSLCVNPEHLYQGTSENNIDDMDNRGRRNAARGEDQGNSKMTEEQVREIRRLYDGADLVVQGFTNKIVHVGVSDIARRYSVSSQTVVNIGKRKTWKHVV
jgi:hypothetical protein